MRKQNVSHSHSSQRLLAVLAVVGIAAGGLMAMPGSAHADDSFSRDGWCRKGEGQTVVIDWRGVVAEGDAIPDPIIRCIQLAPGATDYPLMGNPSPLADPLESAGIAYTADRSGIFTSIGGTSISGDFKWNWATGEVSEAGQGVWEGKSSWSPEAGIDTIVGITLTDKPSDPTVALPAPAPQFEPGDYTNTITPSATPTPTPTPTPSAEPSASATSSATLSSSVTQSPTQPSTTTATTTPPAPTTPASATTTISATTASTTASRTPTTRPRRTTRPPRQTYRPQRPTYQQPPPNYPPPPPVQEPPPPPPVEQPPVEPAPPANPSGEATAPAAASPSLVWGREDVTRQGAEASTSDKPAPWSQLAAVAGAVVVVGGLGTAFARGLQTSTPPVVEEE